MLMISEGYRRLSNLRRGDFARFDWPMLILVLFCLKFDLFHYMFIGFVPFCVCRLDYPFHSWLFVCFVMACVRFCFFYHFSAALAISVLWLLRPVRRLKCHLSYSRDSQWTMCSRVLNLLHFLLLSVMRVVIDSQRCQLFCAWNISKSNGRRRSSHLVRRLEDVLFFLIPLSTAAKGLWSETIWKLVQYEEFLKCLTAQTTASNTNSFIEY